MKFISVLALAACAVLVSAAPHHGGGNSGTSINTNDESNREVKISDKSNTEYTDNSNREVKITDKSNTEYTDNSNTQISDNSNKNIKGNIQNQEENRVQVNKGLLAGLLSGDRLIGDINLLSSNTKSENKGQSAQNNN